MFIECCRQEEGLTVGKVYKLRGVAAEYVEVIADDGKRSVYLDHNFTHIELSIQKPISSIINIIKILISM